MKRRREDGFTLIELMIVIAVIGILAIVLVPQVGSTKDSAKAVGLDTNSRVVQGYIESKISHWDQKNTTGTDVRTDVASTFGAFTGNDALANPFYPSVKTVDTTVATSAAERDAVLITTGQPTDDSDLAGTIVVGIPDAYATSGISIYQYDANGKVIADKTVTVKP